MERWAGFQIEELLNQDNLLITRGKEVEVLGLLTWATEQTTVLLIYGQTAEEKTNFKRWLWGWGGDLVAKCLLEKHEDLS